MKQDTITQQNVPYNTTMSNFQKYSKKIFAPSLYNFCILRQKHQSPKTHQNVVHARPFFQPRGQSHQERRELDYKSPQSQNTEKQYFTQLQYV